MKFWLTILLQLALSGIELLVKMLNRRMDAKEKAKRAAAAATATATATGATVTPNPNPYAGAASQAEFRDELLAQVTRLQETTKSFRRKPTNDAPSAILP